MEIFYKNTEKPTPVELYESITAFPQQQLLETKKGAATGNLFTFKNVIDRVGVFNANLKSNGDLEWGYRVYSAGYQQVYADDTCVAHPARSSFKELYKRTVRLVGGSYDWQNQKQLSFYEKNLSFIKVLFDNIIPPLNFVFNAFKDNRLENINAKIKVCWVMFCVRYISAWEIIRLKLGGVSAR